VSMDGMSVTDSCDDWLQDGGAGDAGERRGVTQRG